MKIKVGNKIYDGETDLVMVILTDKDKENIASMHEKCTKYCQFPNSTGQDTVDEFMYTGEPDEDGRDMFYFFSFTFNRPGSSSVHLSQVSYNEHPFKALKNVAEDYFCSNKGFHGAGGWELSIVSWREITKEEYNMFEKQGFSEIKHRLKKGTANTQEKEDGA